MKTLKFYRALQHFTVPCSGHADVELENGRIVFIEGGAAYVQTARGGHEYAPAVFDSLFVEINPRLFEPIAYMPKSSGGGSFCG